MLQNLDPLLAHPVELTDQEFDDLMAFLLALTSPTTSQGCELIPDSVPSGLPVESDPGAGC
jgi:hypothetical protein